MTDEKRMNSLQGKQHFHSDLNHVNLNLVRCPIKELDMF